MAKSKQKQKKILVTTPETEMMCSIRLYTDKTYEILNSDGEAISHNKWYKEGDYIYLCTGFGEPLGSYDAHRGSFRRQSLNELVLDLKQLIEWEQIEQELLS
jgi:hypothetical protein